MTNELILTDEIVATPPLKWAGGKRWLVPALAGIWQEHAHRRLVEPFVGGMAVALGLRPRRALLSDVNPHLVNFYRWLGSDRGLVCHVEGGLDEAGYYRARDEFNELIRGGVHRSERAAELFYFLNRTAFNGVCRFNAKGGFNVPYGKRKTLQYRENLTDYHSVLAPWEILETSFEGLAVENGDFIYADPPYDEGFTTYSSGGFSWDDQARLVDWLTKHDGPVLASNHDTENIRQCYSAAGFDITEVMAPRRISCNGDRTPKAELLLSRNIDVDLIQRSVLRLSVPVGSKPKARRRAVNEQQSELPNI